MPITRIIIPHLFIYKAHFARTTIALHSKHKRCLQVTQCVKSCLTCPDSIFVYLEAELPATRVKINRTHVIRT